MDSIFIKTFRQDLQDKQDFETLFLRYQLLINYQFKQWQNSDNEFFPRSG